jgi:hypothetical protein
LHARCQSPAALGSVRAVSKDLWRLLGCVHRVCRTRVCSVCQRKLRITSAVLVFAALVVVPVPLWPSPLCDFQRTHAARSAPSPPSSRTSWTTSPLLMPSPGCTSCLARLLSLSSARTAREWWTSAPAEWCRRRWATSSPRSPTAWLGRPQTSLARSRTRAGRAVTSSGEFTLHSLTIYIHGRYSLLWRCSARSLVASAHTLRSYATAA